MSKISGKNAKFSVMSFNLRFGLADDKENAWESRKHLVADIFNTYPVTFIGFQESNHFQTRFLIDHLKGHHYIGWHNPSEERWQSNLVFYDATWKCLKSQHFFLSSTPDIESKMQGSKWPRQCVMGLFEKQGDQIIVTNTHFDFNALVQEKSAQLVCQFLSEFPKDCPVIITGDFNSNAQSLAWKTFELNGFNEVNADQHSTTFHQFVGKETGRHIDWILHRGDIRVLDRQVVCDNDAGQYPSDHYPVVASFST